MPPDLGPDHWCGDCGRAHPDNEPRRLSVRRRLVWPLTRPLATVGRVALGFVERLTEWADGPEKARWREEYAARCGAEAEDAVRAATRQAAR